MKKVFCLCLERRLSRRVNEKEAEICFVLHYFHAKLPEITKKVLFFYLHGKIILPYFIKPIGIVLSAAKSGFCEMAGWE